MLIDSHCHLDLLDLSSHNGLLENALNVAWNQGVEHILNVCVSLESFPEVFAIARHYSPKVSCSVGMHPSEATLHEPTVEDILLRAKETEVIAIGETGLDYHHDFVSPEKQQTRFRAHIQAARALNKPLIIHTRQASEPLLAILKEERAEEVGAVMHCFTESWEVAKQVLDHGFYIGFSGIITFKNADALREVAKRVPIDRILVETDAPYLAPAPKRGKPNEPAYVRYVAEFMADLLKIRFDRFAQQTTENFHRLFRCR